MALTDNFFSIFFNIVDRTSTLILTVDTDQPIVIIGGSLVINSDDSEVIDLKITRNNTDYLILKNFRINNDFPDSFINQIKKLALNSGDKIYIQAKNSYGVTANPNLSGYISYVKQPKLN